MPPYLSVVVTARNDNYGGHFLHRFTNFLATLSELCDREQLDAELIVVEWNPPADRARLIDAATWPSPRRHLEIRLIEVPPNLHGRIENADRIPLFEYHAKNAGIRRAEGEFVLSTNADVLLNAELVRHLAGRPLSTDRFYRISRWDVRELPPLGMSLDDRMRFCDRHVHRRSAFDTFLPVRTGARDVHTPRVMARRLRQWWKRLRRGLEYRVYTCAAGDFTLMARSAWHELRGYPQIPARYGIDGYMCYIAATGGLSQQVLTPPMRLYHQDHDRHSGDRGPQGRPAFDSRQYREDRRRMIRSGRPMIFNDERWGLGEESPRECRVP